MSDINRKKFSQFWNIHKGEFIITGNHVERFLAIVDDDFDFYYVCYDGRKLKLYTCVGKLVTLKNKIDTKDYNEFIRLAKLNHYDQLDSTGKHIAEITEELLKEVKLDPDDERNYHCGTNKLVTDICWDLN